MQLFEFLLNERLLSRVTTVRVKKQLIDMISTKMPNIPKEDITTKISLFSHKILLRWKASGRNKKSFFKKNKEWLKKEIYQSDVQIIQQQYRLTPTSRHRAIKEFDTISTRTKRRRTKSLVANYSSEELAFATQTSFIKKGKRNIAHVI